MAAFEECASHVFINHKFDLCEVFDFMASIDLFVADTLDKISFLWIASIGTPELLEVDTAQWYIFPKNGINLLKATAHYHNLIVIATHRLRDIHKWAYFCKSSDVLHGSRFEERDHWIKNFLGVRAKWKMWIRFYAVLGDGAR